MTAAASRPSTRQLVALGAAASLVPLNSTMIAVALPRIAEDFDRSVGSVSVLVTIYLVAMLVGQPVAGRVTDRIGTDRAIRIALTLFLVASVGGALATTFAILLVARFAQAVAGSLLVPSVQAMLRNTVDPDDRGRIFGLFGSMLGMGAAAGPVIAGGLIEVWDWPAIFVVNVPVIVAALLVPLSRVRTVAAPMALDAAPLRRNPVFRASFSIQALTTFGQYLLLLVAPVLLEARDWSSAGIGIGLSALTIGMVVMGPVGGRVGDRVGRRFPVLVGVAVSAVALAGVALAGDDVGAVLLVACLLGFGVGLGFASPSVMTAALESVDERRSGTAAGVLSMSRYVGSITTSLLVGAWIADDGTGARGAFVLAVVAAVLALGATTRLPVRPSAEQPLGQPVR